jgi:hypothetical protein
MNELTCKRAPTSVACDYMSRSLCYDQIPLKSNIFYFYSRVGLMVANTKLQKFAYWTACLRARLRNDFRATTVREWAKMCPVCGYGMEDPPEDYNICPSCGTEFGNHDVNTSIGNLRASWLRSGAKWWNPLSGPPTGWDAYEQLNALMDQCSYGSINAIV